MMIRHHFHLTCLLVIIINPNNGLLTTANDGDDDNSDVSRDTTAETDESRIAPDAGQSDSISRRVRNTDDQEVSSAIVRVIYSDAKGNKRAVTRTTSGRLRKPGKSLSLRKLKKTSSRLRRPSSAKLVKKKKKRK